VQAESQANPFCAETRKSDLFGLKTKRFELQKWDCAQFVHLFKQILEPTKIFCFEKSEAVKKAAF